MGSNEVSLRDFIKENTTLFNAFGVFAALSIYFKSNNLDESTILAPFFLFILIGMELYRCLPKKEDRSITLMIFEAGLFWLLLSISYYILEEYSSGRIIFGMLLSICLLLIILRSRLSEYVTSEINEHKLTLAILYGTAIFLWGIVLLNYIRSVELNASYFDVLFGFVTGITFIPFLLLMNYALKKLIP